MRVAGPLFLPCVQKVIRDERGGRDLPEGVLTPDRGNGIGEIDDTATSTIAHSGDRRLRLRMGASVPGGVAQPSMPKVNEFWIQSLVRHLVFRVIQPWPVDRFA